MTSTRIQTKFDAITASASTKERYSNRKTVINIRNSLNAPADHITSALPEPPEDMAF